MLHANVFYCTVLYHLVSCYCIVLYGIERCYMLLHGIACTILYCILWYYMVLHGINQSHILREDTFIYSGTWYMVPWYNHIILLWSLLCQSKKHSININTTLSKMPGVTSEVCSDKSWTYVLTFDVWYLTFDIWHVTFDIKTFAHLNFWTFEHLNIWTFEHWIPMIPIM